MAKVRLLNDGGFIGFECVRFPVTVEVQGISVNNVAYVSTDELKKIPDADLEDFSDDDPVYLFMIPNECELVDEKDQS